MEHVLVTGGAGYIGSILVPNLLANGFKVTVVDNFMFGQSSLVECCLNPNFEIIRGDCRDQKVLQKPMASADWVIPLAALVGAPMCNNDKLAAQSTNFGAVDTLLSMASKDQRFLYPNTNSGYGIGDKHNMCTEETPLKPISLYGTSKTEAEDAVLQSGKGLTFRLATVFGMSPRMRTDLLVNDFVHRAVMDRAVVIFEGHFKRNYIHIRDIAQAFQHAIKNFESMKNQAYNVGLSEANFSKLELCARIKKHLPEFVYLEAPIGEDPDKRDYIVSNEKLEKTGWRPNVTLDNGIEELIKGYKIIRNSKYSNV